MPAVRLALVYDCTLAPSVAICVKVLPLVLRSTWNCASFEALSSHVSAIDVDGAPFRDADADAALFTALRDGLAGSATYAQQIDAQERVVVAARQRQRLSQLRYDAGQDSRLELLDAQRQSYAAQQALLDARRDQFKSSVALYKALGGGLEE